MTEYPIILADFEFHEEHYQIWNQEERLWFVQERRWEEYPTWELLFQL